MGAWSLLGSLRALALRAMAAVAVLVLWGSLGAQGAWGASTRNFAVQGDHPYVVPAGVTSIIVKAVGAGGGNCLPAHGGKGASITATVPVTPGEALIVRVGGPGGACGGLTAPPGGFGGGGSGGKGTHVGRAGAGGGGASAVAPGSSSPDLAQALVVAGGGGGSTDFNVGIGGGNAGSPGKHGSVSGSGGGAGTQSAGGAGGVAGDANAQAGFPGSLGAGGAGGHGDMPSGTAIGGGGGGGGYYGGGGGGGSAGDQDSGAGGGGSSYAVPGATNVRGPTPTPSLPVVTITPTSAPAAVKIVYSKISDRRHTAKFAFAAIAPATGFQCAVVRRKKHHRRSKASFSSCSSPKGYKHLKPGRYIFEVRAVNAGVPSRPTDKRFTIT